MAQIWSMSGHGHQRNTGKQRNSIQEQINGLLPKISRKRPKIPAISQIFAKRKKIAKNSKIHRRNYSRSQKTSNESDIAAGSISARKMDLEPNNQKIATPQNFIHNANIAKYRCCKRCKIHTQTSTSANAAHFAK